MEALGVEPWWDTSLNGADNFTEEIQKQLVDAKAVIVIWSAHSITSTYVRKEASIALQSKKLIATRTVDLDYAALPDGFREQHTDLVEDLKQIEAALRKLGVCPPFYPTPKQRTEHPQVRDARLEIIEWEAQMDARSRDHAKELAEADAQLAKLHSDQQRRFALKSKKRSLK